MKPKKELFTDEYDKKMKRLAGNDGPESKRKSVKPAEAEPTTGIRINKYMAESGMCSRREADKLVADGKVYIDGVQAVMGSKVLPGQKVTVKGQDIKKNEDLVLIAFNKPVGIVSTTDKREKDNIIDYINYGKRIFPIGRLDKESEGLILLTNDGDIVNKILRAGNYHEKEYVVTVNKDITPEFLKAMSSGVPILDTVTRPCKIEQIDKKVFKIILTQGLNRQIRRMCEALGYRVRSLIRIRIMNIKLNHLKSGTYRNLTPKELEELRQMIADSSNAPIQRSMNDER
ncbi:MAG: 23S rRNA pseudouridine(2604) synthase RluF [Lachnospiraceae bacterium]|nr:23S rRNA pseudouridine(2604) synthase RluF [Lachnospiraceae bacterium]